MNQTGKLECITHEALSLGMDVFLQSQVRWKHSGARTLGADMLKKLEAAEMGFLRKILRISYTEDVTNEESFAEQIHKESF